jgi:hypothetical protein
MPHFTPRPLPATLAGLTLLASALVGACASTAAPGDTGGQSATLSGEPSAAPSAPAKPSASPPSCRTVKLGDGSTCIDHSTLKQRATDACASPEVFANLVLGPPCANGALSAEVTCCVGSPKPACTGKVIGDGSACLDPSTVGTQAVAACAADSAVATQISFGAAPGCALGNVAKVLCCPASSAAPPAPGR